jgi:16S rRNA (adenine1518-N6/adenine1519-N6)-dimethyltransferase
VRANKQLGQHFLEPAWVAKVVAAIEPGPEEAFIEIGPGRGALTTPLAEASAQVVACELDRALADELVRTAPANLTVVHGDFTRIPPAVLTTALSGAGAPARAVRAAGNLPYNVGSQVLLRLIALLDAGLPLIDATVMLQREVADRLLAAPGTRDYGVLTVVLRHRAVIERLLHIPPGAFRPIPKVESTLLRLRFHAPDPTPSDQSTFVALTRAVFTRRRKTLANALRAFRVEAPSPGEALARAGLDGRRRPETLEIAELVRLADVYATMLSPAKRAVL